MVKIESACTSSNASQAEPRLPVGAADCHVHIFDPLRFPYLESRRYTPPEATVDDLIQLHAKLGFSRAVLVQPSVYGTNSACLIDALHRLGPAARGIAVIDKATSDMELDALAGAGVCGVRLNLQVARQDDGSIAVAQFEQTLQQIQGRFSVVQINCALAVAQKLAPTIMQSTVPILLDHFGHVQARLGAEQTGFETLEALLKAGKIYLKLSGPYQISRMAPSYADIAPIAQRLVAANPEHIVWGSDWPHTGGAERPANCNPLEIEPFRSEDDRYNLGLLNSWAKVSAVRQAILVDTPARLFGFPR